MAIKSATIPKGGRNDGVNGIGYVKVATKPAALLEGAHVYFSYCLRYHQSPRQTRATVKSILPNFYNRIIYAFKIHNLRNDKFPYSIYTVDMPNKSHLRWIGAGDSIQQVTRLEIVGKGLQRETGQKQKGKKLFFHRGCF